MFVFAEQPFEFCKGVIVMQTKGDEKFSSPFVYEYNSIINLAPILKPAEKASDSVISVSLS